MDKPNDWKNYEDFAAGIDTNRLPCTDELAGQKWTITLSDGQTLTYQFSSQDTLDWQEGPDTGISDWYEAIVVAPDTYLLDMTYTAKPRDSRTLVVNTKTRRALSILSQVGEKKIEGQPLVSQIFLSGILGDPAIAPSGMEPVPTRDLIGLRTFQRYSPNHLYEHTYLSSERYCWQNLIGEQRGHGDVDLASYYKFDTDQYIFTFREFIIPVASVFFFNFDSMRSTGKFLGVTGDGKIENNKAGAFMQKASMTFYEKGCEPV